MKAKRIVALATTAALCSMTCTPALAAEGSKWTEEATADGWVKVTNDGGETLGYSPESGVTIIEDDGYAFKDLNQNGQLDPYEDWRLDDQTRAENLASLMTTDEQLGLMFQNNYDFAYERGGDISDDIKTAIENGIHTFSAPFSFGSTEDAVHYDNTMQAYAEARGYGIPVNIAAEAGVDVAASWPTNLALAATFDPEIAAEYGETMSQEFRALGLGSMISPQMDLATEPRWGRTVNTFGEDPQLSMDMAEAMTNSLQSSYDEDGNDLGWGTDSVNATLKHFPGDGCGESGRESHENQGKYAVYPGDQMYTSMLVFEAALNLSGATGSAAAVMPSYSIAVDADGKSIGDPVGSIYSEYKLQDLLRDELGFEGVIISDYGIIEGMPGFTGRFWGMEGDDVTVEERRLAAVIAGCDMFGGESAIDQLRGAYELGVEEYGEDYMVERINESAVRILKMLLQVGLFENAYVNEKESLAIVNSEEKAAAAYEANLKSVIMLKNATGLIAENTGSEEKPTAYVPYTQDDSGNWVLNIDLETVRQYFNLVTDTVDDDNNVTRAADEDIASCDYALVIMNDPYNENGMSSGYDTETDTYYPISLQYGEYVADGENVRSTSISGDEVEVTIESPYGAQTTTTKENRSYYGQTSRIQNAGNLDTVLFAAEKNDNVIVVVNADKALCFGEFEGVADSILLHFGACDQAICEIITGQYEPSGLLPLQMPKDMDAVEGQLEDVPRDMECYTDSEGNTYDFAYGMNWSGVIDDERVETYSVEPLVG